jgi:PTH1 family peptidyl-tRNA hydrolase
MKPLTYMNLSGEAVQAAAAFYKIDPAKELIVLYDDISLEPGQLRVRAKGSAGGHNGIRSIIRMLGTDQFLRVKIGTGAKPADMDLADYVLGRIPLSERADMAAAFDRASKAAADLVTQPLDRVMNEYNRKIEKVPEA